ncbi:serine hydrolase domain-containing protein [Micromonospora polyrhachis]|uniref:CubicO group peptidase (Beta-lactamase class C family) n=1 Tax=Micromonospora polyrhachis TaxID=1282883 RepID=A0A7W7WPJ8_9ACTN|nr:serine hydrolase domain-containing protein [Micromonospora polyrhachis]MBB4959311.1 CubicO group peptidase (beta-lactamase class C family) [Micromonospora polyrhachis]
MSRKFVGALAALVASAAAVGTVAMPTVAYAETGGIDPAAVEHYVTEYAERAAYPGVAVAITRGDTVLLTAGYGHDSAGAAITAATPMPVASVSKSFTALAVLQLVEAKKVALDAPVRDYLPEFRIADPRGERITVRQLLNQTSGLTDGTHPEKSLPQPDSLAGAVSRARTAKLAVEPGTKHYYTNTNFHIAARLVEVVAGEPFGDYLRRHVLEPAGMRASVTIDKAPGDLPTNLEKGYVYAYGASIPTTEPNRFVNGSDGLITTAEDMARWLIVHSNGGKSASGEQLITPESIKMMHTSSDPRWTYGLGWDTEAGGRVRHSGIWFTHTAGQLLLPSGHGIAVMTNSGIGLGNEGTNELVNGLATIVQGGTPSVGAPIRLIIDVVLGGLALLSLALGIRTLRRVPVWARRLADRPIWRLALRLLPRFVPLAFLIAMPTLLGLLFAGGRDLTHFQLLHYSVALTVWLVVASLMGVSVTVARVTAVLRLRRARVGRVDCDVDRIEEHRAPV